MSGGRSDGCEETGGLVLAVEMAFGTGGGGGLCGEAGPGAKKAAGAEFIAVTVGGGASSAD
jgi:hypothetical protein